jgi:hypothetical protein
MEEGFKLEKLEKRMIFERYIGKYLNNTLTINNYFKDEDYYELWGIISEDLKEHSKLIFDGRRDDAFRRTLEKIDTEASYEEFFAILLEEISEYNDDNILIVPMNGLQKELLNDVIEFDNPNFMLFAVKESNFKIQRDKTKIAKYVKNKMQLRLNMQHMIFKDRNYFNSPVLTIIIKGNNDNEIYHEAQQIVQGIYSLIRMNDLLNDSKKSGWNSFTARRYPVTYAVYNKCGRKNSEIDGGCGHQMKIFCSPLLDVNTAVFLQNKSVLVNRFDYLIQSIFESRIDGIDKEFYAKKRWINSLTMFNTAYDLASIERYDATLVTLISILESIFLKPNTSLKKENLKNKVSSFLNKDYSNLIDISYKRRSDYVHEGKTIGGIMRFKLAENEHNYVPGYKPFTQYSMFGFPDQITDLSKLMNVCAEVIFKMIDDKKFQVGQYDQ